MYGTTAHRPVTQVVLLDQRRAANDPVTAPEPALGHRFFSGIGSAGHKLPRWVIELQESSGG
jgi:hypothetical protein